MIEDGEEEWEVEEVLDSGVSRGKLKYLIKWKDFGRESNSWEPANGIFAPEAVAEFHRKHPGAPRNIRTLDFGSIPFRSVPVPITSSRRDLKGGVAVRGTSGSPDAL